MCVWKSIHVTRYLPGVSLYLFLSLSYCVSVMSHECLHVCLCVNLCICEGVYGGVRLISNVFLDGILPYSLRHILSWTQSSQYTESLQLVLRTHVGPHLCFPRARITGEMLCPPDIYMAWGSELWSSSLRLAQQMLQPLSHLPSQLLRFLRCLSLVDRLSAVTVSHHWN